MRHALRANGFGWPSALEKLPWMRIWLSAGRLHWSAVRELTRVVTPDTEAEWIDAVDGRSIREVEQAVAGRVPGDKPTEPARPYRVKKRLSFEVAPEVYAIFREAAGRLRQQSETPMSDEDALPEMARRVLGGPRDEGEASYQIALTTCPSCGAAEEPGCGEVVPVDDVVVEQAMCDVRTFEGVSAAPPSDETQLTTQVGQGVPEAEAGRAAAGAEPAARKGASIACRRP